MRDIRVQQMAEKLYEGIHKDPTGAMNPTGNIIRDAWVFGLIPETESCEGWRVEGIQALYDKVTTEWEKYGHLVSNLPPELAQRHRRIYQDAVNNAKAKGWKPELHDND
jgi:hypothetical protein